MGDDLTCFKAYDIRGRVGIDLTEEIAARIACAMAAELGARRIVLARDVRPSSAPFAAAIAAALAESGVRVLYLGLAGTEEMYFATAHLAADGGICVTASHNPAGDNGMKLVGAGAAPLSPGTFAAIRLRAGRRATPVRDDPPPAGGGITDASDLRAAYVDHVLRFVDPARLGPLHILVNCGNGAAGPTFDAVAGALAARGARLRYTRMHHDPDGRFPNGVPNPLLPATHPATAAALRAAGADMGVAFDGDFDRCFFFDHEGRFVPGEIVVALLADAFLAREPGAAILHDPRSVLATRHAIARAGGRAVMVPTGHAHLKRAMRDTGAVYGGEMSAHHYFRDFFCCDSGMIPWLLVADLICRSGQRLGALVSDLRDAFPSSGEINFRVPDTAAAIARIEAAYAPQARTRDDSDGLSLDFGTWRLNLRASNTEPLLRLNVESRARPDLVEQAVAEITALLA